jgi:BarH-like protein
VPYPWEYIAYVENCRAPIFKAISAGHGLGKWKMWKELLRAQEKAHQRGRHGHWPRCLCLCICFADNDGGNTANAEERRKRPRTAFTADQIRTLENEFQKNKYLSVTKKMELSSTLGLTETQVCYQALSTASTACNAGYILQTPSVGVWRAINIIPQRPVSLRLIGDRFSGVQLIWTSASNRWRPTSEWIVWC